jgi:hypothetical protein
MAAAFLTEAEPKLAHQDLFPFFPNRKHGPETAQI